MIALLDTTWVGTEEDLPDCEDQDVTLLGRPNLGIMGNVARLRACGITSPGTFCKEMIEKFWLGTGDSLWYITQQRFDSLSALARLRLQMESNNLVWNTEHVKNGYANVIFNGDTVNQINVALYGTMYEGSVGTGTFFFNRTTGDIVGFSDTWDLDLDADRPPMWDLLIAGLTRIGLPSSVRPHTFKYPPPT